MSKILCSNVEPLEGKIIKNITWSNDWRTGTKIKFQAEDEFREYEVKYSLGFEGELKYLNTIEFNEKLNEIDKEINKIEYTNLDKILFEIDNRVIEISNHYKFREIQKMTINYLLDVFKKTINKFIQENKETKFYNE